MKKKLSIGFHEGEGTGSELIPGAYIFCEILQKKFPEIELIKIPLLYEGYAKMNSKSKKIFDDIRKAGGSVLSGAISGDNTYDLRASYKFVYKIVEVNPIPSQEKFSQLKSEIRDNIDWLLIRHNNGIFTNSKDHWVKKDSIAEWSTSYTYEELEKISEICFKLAQKRKKKVTLMVKSKQESKVIEVWEKAFLAASKKYKDVEFGILNPDYVAADALVSPEKYDVFFMPDIIGDMMADVFTSLVNGNRNFDGSANFTFGGFSYYNTLHGAAFDLEGKNLINPSGTISNLALMFKYSFDREDVYDIIKRVLNNVLKKYNSHDCISEKVKSCTTSEMFEELGKELKKELKIK